MDDVVERYNQALRGVENDTIRLVNKILDASFNRLVRRTRQYMRAGGRYADPAQRAVYLLHDFRQLVPSFSPEKVDPYDRVFTNLARDAHRYGIGIAEELLPRARPQIDRIDVVLPTEAVVAAAQEAKGYLRKHGETFAQTSAVVVGQGIAEGRPTDAMVSDMRARLDVTKSRARMIVRTEALRAYNKASDVYYSRHGVEYVMYYATADDRACPWCVPRAGQIYKRTDVYTPIHPQCRCYLAPWDPNLETMDPDYVEWQARHEREVKDASKTIDPKALNQAAVFETLAPTPV